MRKKAINPYISIFKMKLINSMVYRASAINHIFLGAAFGFMLTSVMLVFYKYGSTDNVVMTQSQAVTHMWMTEVFIGLIWYRENAEIHSKISSGAVGYDLCRPLDLYWNWYANSIGDNMVMATLKSPAIVILALLLPAPYTMMLPVSFIAFLLFILSLSLAVLLCGSIIVLISLTFINADIGRGLAALISTTIMLFSGFLFPLSILSDKVSAILRLLPFAGLNDIPIAIYLGIINQLDAIKYIGLQIVWLLIFIALGRFILNRYMRLIVIQGG